MPITVFDGLAKFSADTSQLDQFIVKLEQGLTSASEKAAASTQALKAAQDEFRESIRAVSAEGGDTVANLERLAQAEENLALASTAAKQEHAALRSELAGTKESSSLAAEAFDELGGHLTQMLGILAAVEGFKMLLEGTQKSVLNLELLSEKTGIAIDQLAGIEHVAERAGVSFDAVSTALVRLSRAQAIAIEQDGKQRQSFKNLGISIDELKKLSPEELFFRVGEAMASSASHAKENEAAFNLLGRGGSALIPIFQQNTSELRQMVDEAAKASGVTKEAGLAAREWEAQTANLTEAFRAGMIPVMELLVPVMKAAESGASALWADLKDVGVGIGAFFIALFDGAKGLGSLAVDIMTGDMSQLVSDAKNMGGDFTKNWQTTTAMWKADNQQAAESIRHIWTEVKPLQPLKDDLSDIGSTSNDKGLTKFLEAQAQAKKAFEAAQLELEKAEAMESVQLTEQTYSLKTQTTKAGTAAELDLIAKAQLDKLAIENAYKQQSYDLQVKDLQDRIALLTKDDNETKAQKVKLQGELDALETKHQAQTIEQYTALMERLREITAQPIPLVNTAPAGMDQITNDVTKNFDKARAAAAGLGVTLRVDLDASLADAHKNFAALNDLFVKGVVTQKDLDQGYIKLVQAQLEFAKATGVSAAQIAILQKELDQLTSKDTKQFDDFGKHSHMTWENFREDMKNGVNGMKEFQAGGIQAFDQVMQGMESAIAAAELGQKSFGAAMEKATAQALASLSAQALVKALFYTAEGFAALAGFDAAGAAEYFEAAGIMAAVGVAAGAAAMGLSGGASGGSGGPGGTSGMMGPQPVETTGGSTQTKQGGPTTVSVAALASGGLATEPTLVIVGDSKAGGKAAEAILPLEDDHAMSTIAAAMSSKLMTAMPGMDSDFRFPRLAEGGVVDDGTIMPLTDPAALGKIVDAMRAPGTIDSAPLLAPATLAAAAAAHPTPTRSYDTNPVPAGTHSDQAIARLTDAINSNFESSARSAGGDTHNHLNVPRSALVLAPGNLKALLKHMNKAVKQGTGHLKSSDTMRITRRSQ